MDNSTSLLFAFFAQTELESDDFIIPIVQGPKYFYIKNKVILIVVGRSYMGIHSNKRRERATQENTYLRHIYVSAAPAVCEVAKFWG